MVGHIPRLITVIDDLLFVISLKVVGTLTPKKQQKQTNDKPEPTQNMACSSLQLFALRSTKKMLSLSIKKVNSGTNKMAVHSMDRV